MKNEQIITAQEFEELVVYELGWNISMFLGVIGLARNSFYLWKKRSSVPYRYILMIRLLIKCPEIAKEERRIYLESKRED